MKKRAERNRTLTCSKDEIDRLSANILQVNNPVTIGEIDGKIISGDTFEL